MYVAHSKRLEVERATDVKNAMISGLWSNSNLDDGKNTREQALAEIEQNYQDILRTIYSSNFVAEEIDINTHPLFTAMNLDIDQEPTPIDAVVRDRTTTIDQS